MKTVLLLTVLLAFVTLSALPSAGAAHPGCTDLTHSQPCGGVLCTGWDEQQQRYTQCHVVVVQCFTDPCWPEI